jgi:broad specificity phosphatase PhoE
MTTLVLIRHGETDWNVEARYQGQADPPLNEQGVAQAHRLAESLVDVGLDVIYTSPLQRALQTAELLAQQLEIPLREEPRLMEINQGEWQGLLRSEIEERYPKLFQRWLTQPWSVTPPAGESLQQVQARVDAVLDDIVGRHPEECVGLVAHRIPIALIKVRYQGQELDIVRTLDLPNAYWEEIRDLER